MKKVFFVLILVLIFVCFVFRISIEEEPPLVSPEPLTTSSSQEVSLHLVAVGDNLIHGPIYREAAVRTGGEGFDFQPVYELVAPYVANADLAFINQETPLGGTELGLSSYPQFNSPQELGDCLTNLGFNLISHANNHVLDQGEKGFANTLHYWSGQEKAVMAGIYSDQTTAAQVPVLEKDGVSVAFLAYTYGTNGLVLPADSNGDVAYIDEERMLSDIKKAHEAADIVIVSMHWGMEYQQTPTEKQKQLAAQLAAADVDIVLGHHPHVIQPVTVLEQPDGGSTVVYYSLGNFVSNQDNPATMLGGMAAVDFVYQMEEDQVVFDSIRFIPLVTHYGKKFSDTKIYPLADYTEELAAQHGIRQKNADFSLDYLTKLARNTIAVDYLEYVQ